MIFADFLELSGKHYLIIGDRLSGWTEIVFVRKGTTTSGAKGLCNALRKLFGTFGVPEEISSDGGPEFQAVNEAIHTWCIRHEMSAEFSPEYNGEAEAAVKKVLLDITHAKNKLDSLSASVANIN